MVAPGVEQSTFSSHSLPATAQHYCQVMIVSMKAIETRLAAELETRPQPSLQRCKLYTVQGRDGFTRSGSPHRLSSVCCNVVQCRLPMREAFDGQHQAHRAGSPSWSPHHFVSFLISFRSFRFYNNPINTEAQNDLTYCTIN